MIVNEHFEPTPPPVSAERACRVCASRRVWVDEVLERGVLGLAQCSRCDYRWTWRLQRMSVARRQVDEVRRVA